MKIASNLGADEIFPVRSDFPELSNYILSNDAKDAVKKSYDLIQKHHKKMQY